MKTALLSLAALLLTSGCTADTCSKLPFSTSVGAPVLLSDKLARAMGAVVSPLDCAEAGTQSQGVDGAGESASLVDASKVKGLVKGIVVPVLPQFDTSGAYVVAPKLIRVSGEGTTSDLYVFDDPPESYQTGFLAGQIIDGQVVQLPRGLVVSVAESSSGEVFVGNSVTGEVLSISGGTRLTLATLDGVCGLALDAAGTLYAATSPVYDFGSPPNLLAPPKIVKLAPGAAPADFYTFPADGERYKTGFSSCYGSRCIARGFAAAMELDEAGNLLVATTFGGAIVSIDGWGNASDKLSGAVGASGIAIGRDGNLYFTESPLLDINGAVTSGVKVRMLDAGGTVTTLWEGPANAAYDSGFLSGTGGGVFYPLDAVFGLNLDGNGDLFLEDSMLGTFTLLPRE
jgi:hypothetical protein